MVKRFSSDATLNENSLQTFDQLSYMIFSNQQRASCNATYWKTSAITVKLLKSKLLASGGRPTVSRLPKMTASVWTRLAKD